MSRLILGKQELLILLVDLSGSMYTDDNNNVLNKYLQVQNSIHSLIERINSTNKANHILISIVLFAEKTWTIELFDDESPYNHSKDWLNVHDIENFFKRFNMEHDDRLERIGLNTSLSEAFIQSKKIIEYFFADNNIAPENKKGVSIMLFSDGIENISADLISSLETIKTAIQNQVEEKIVNPDDKNNLGISSIAIGKDADELVLKTISTPYSERQWAHIKRLRESDIEASNRLDPLKCFLKLNANNNCIDDNELNVLRKFLYLVTDSPLPN